MKFNIFLEPEKRPSFVFLFEQLEEIGRKMSMNLSSSKTPADAEVAEPLYSVTQDYTYSEIDIKVYN